MTLDSALPPQQSHKAWPKTLLPLIQEISGDYQLNSCIKGIRTECLRRHSSGLWVSHNTVKVRTRYNHGFALLFTNSVTFSYLYSPLFAGSRFDHNFDIWRAFAEYSKSSQTSSEKPASVQSSHSWLKGFESIVRNCAAKAERELLPYYIENLSKGRASLYALFDHAAKLLEQIDPTPERMDSLVGQEEGLNEFAEQFRLSQDNLSSWDPMLVRYWNILREAQRHGIIEVSEALRHRISSINLKATDIVSMPSRLTGIPEKHRATCIVLNNFEHFVPIRTELPAILDVIMKI